MTTDDCLYCCLPLYHSSATAIGVPMAIAARARLALARKFSATRFWADCRANQATVCLYIGELCRYLYLQPPGPGDRDHQVRCFVGNGLRPDVWDGFCERFGIEHPIFAFTPSDHVAAAEKAYGEARTFSAVFSFSYFSRKKQTELALAEARAALASVRQVEGRKVAAVAHATENVAAANRVTEGAVAAHLDQAHRDRRKIGSGAITRPRPERRDRLRQARRGRTSAATTLRSGDQKEHT
jgi:acyl-CoA synthetase (AMP-forming)/AMP-acid ligase II